MKVFLYTFLIFKIVFLFNITYPKYLNNIDTIDINEKEIDPNSLCSGIKSLFDGTNQLIIEQHPIAGINYLLDGISSFFIDCTKKVKIDDNLKNDFNDLIIKFKYQVTVLINTYFKLYKTDSNFYMNDKQKKQIADKVKQIFSNALGILESPYELGKYLKESFTKVFDIVSIIFSVNHLVDIENKSFTPINEALVPYRMLVTKCDEIKINQVKNNFNQKEINNGLVQIFNSIVDLGMEPNINFIHFKETMFGLLKVISAIFSDEYKASKI